MLEQLEQHLRHSVARIQRDPDDWRPLEALLHAYASVAETVAESDTHYVPRFLESIPQIPFGENVHLITVALSTLGELFVQNIVHLYALAIATVEPCYIINPDILEISLFRGVNST